MYGFFPNNMIKFEYVHAHVYVEAGGWYPVSSVTTSTLAFETGSLTELTLCSKSSGLACQQAVALSSLSYPFPQPSDTDAHSHVGLSHVCVWIQTRATMLAQQPLYWLTFLWCRIMRFPLSLLLNCSSFLLLHGCLQSIQDVVHE